MTKKLPQLKANAKREGWADWIRSDADERAMLAGCTFKASLGEHVCGFFTKFLRIGEATVSCEAGEPFVPWPWQRDVLMPVFGWIRPDGYRRFRKTYVSVPKKSGKSPLAAGIGDYMLVGDGERGAKIASVATTTKQASIVHDEAIRMVKQSPPLLAKLKVNHTTKSIYRPDDPTCWYQAFAGELDPSARAKEGFNLHAAISDELHAWSGTKLYDVLQYAFISRRQPLWFIITTAGVVDATSIALEEYGRAKQVQAGELVDQELFVYITEAEKDDDWTAEATWRKANPALGLSITLEEIGKSCERAKANLRQKNTFCRYRLNQWVDQAVQWIAREQWDACAGKPEIPDKAVVVLGGDLSTVEDLTALTMLYRDAADTYHVECWFWLPDKTVRNRQHKNHALYQQWAKDGHLLVSPGECVDYEAVRNKVKKLGKQYSVAEVCLDPHNAHRLISDLIDHDGFEVVETRQGFLTLNEPSKELERMLLTRRLRHGAHPVLDWMAHHVAIKEDDAGNIKPIKPPRADHRKIDGIVAMVTGLSRSMLRPCAPKRSIYTTDKRSKGFLKL